MLGWIDALRVAAIVAVVTIHCLSATRNSGIRLYSPAWWAADFLDAGCRWAVPVFVMISGGLLLDTRRAEPGGWFLRRRAARIGVPLLFWTTFYVAYRRWFLGQPLTAAAAWHEVVAGRPFVQLYYLFIIAGLYLVTPPLRQLWRPLSRAQRARLAAGALGVGLLDHAITAFAHVGGANAVTEFVPYIGYYLAGSVLREWPLPTGAAARLLRNALGVVLASGWVLTAVVSAALTAHYGDRSPAYYLFDYLSPTIVPMALAVFTLGRLLGDVRFDSAWLRRLGSATFGVFLLHPVVLYWLLHRARPGPSLATVVAVVPAVVLAAVAVSLAVTLVAQRLPGVRRLVGA